MNERSATRRLFFALWPSDDLREQIARAVEPLLAGRRARPIPAANLHMTLAFLGSVLETKLPDVMAAAREVTGAPFVLRLDRAESWRRAQVAWLPVDPMPPALSALVERLRFSLLARELEVDRKDFRAHVTIARNWRDRPLDARIGPFEWRVREFALVQSKTDPRGSEYFVLERWPLREGSA
ncbi:MAG TPA: RNA 2',3'-cyclic phosphodiesterase [Steroidobacteraceae bacterium]